MGKVKDKKARYRDMMKKVLRESAEPLTTKEILGRLMDRGYRMIPATNQAAQILGRSDEFVRVEYLRDRNILCWTVKEEWP